MNNETIDLPLIHRSVTQNCEVSIRYTKVQATYFRWLHFFGSPPERDRLNRAGLI